MGASRGEIARGLASESDPILPISLRANRFWRDLSAASLDWHATRFCRAYPDTRPSQVISNHEDEAMLRITTLDDCERPAVLKLEGKLLEPWIEELAAACSRINAERGPATIDLSAVSYVDARAAEALCRWRRSGVRVVGCSPLVAGLIGCDELAS